MSAHQNPLEFIGLIGTQEASESGRGIGSPGVIDESYVSAAARAHEYGGLDRFRRVGWKRRIFLGSMRGIKEVRPSFLKKRSKRLLCLRQRHDTGHVPDLSARFRRKRLLVLFFRKEHSYTNPD